MISMHDLVLGYSRFGILEVQSRESTSVSNQISFDFGLHFVTDQIKWNKKWNQGQKMTSPLNELKL